MDTQVPAGRGGSPTHTHWPEGALSSVHLKLRLTCAQILASDGLRFESRAV